RRPQGIGSARNLGLHHPDHLTPCPQEFAMSKTAVTSPELAPPVGPFSQAIEVGGFVYFSGQVGQDPATGKVVEGGIVAETERVFRNLSGVLKAAGKSCDDVARAGVYLTSMSDFVALNGVYAKHFSQPFPARTTIAVAALPLGACVEIDLVVKALRQHTEVDLMKYPFHIVDVFSSTPFGGNQLAVLPDAAGISTEGMQKIAREFNFGETTFVLPKNDPANTCRVRIFTPRAELEFAGHPTVGTACALVMKQHERLSDPIRLILEENVGPVTVDVAQRNRGFHGTLTLSGQIEA